MLNLSFSLGQVAHNLLLRRAHWHHCAGHFFVSLQLNSWLTAEKADTFVGGWTSEVRLAVGLLATAWVDDLSSSYATPHR